MSIDASLISIPEKATNTAAEFWAALSPETPLFPQPRLLLYRGQGDASWGLEPSISRDPENKLGVLKVSGAVPSDFQVFKEWVYLKSFVDHCDSIALRIPNKSREFRRLFLDAPGSGMAFIETSLWPPSELYDLLALAQHHGLPTRMLDWSTRSYVAAYFAISDAFKRHRGTTGSDRLAVWVLNVALKEALYPRLETIKVAGSNNPNLAAQAGVFTLLRQQGVRGKPFEGDTGLDKYFLKQNLPIPLLKVTLPVSEAEFALNLCTLYGVTGATLFPDFYGAARGARDVMLTSIFHA